MDRLKPWLLPAAVLLAVIVAAAVWWWPRPPAALPPAGDVPSATVLPPAPPAVAAASAPAIKYPLDAASAVPAAPQDATVAALGELLGAKALHAWVHTDNFAQRFVTTVDNLGRPFAAPRLRPVQSAPGRFEVTGSGGDAATRTIAPANAERYAAFVRFVDGVDTPRAVATYKQIYPQLQREYEALGYPGRYFNDRVVEVIDQLLATPEPKGPLAVRLAEVKGPVASKRPWEHYEFEDEQLQSLPSGQKLLLRMGPEHARHLKAKLRELRAQLVAGG